MKMALSLACMVKKDRGVKPLRPVLLHLSKCRSLPRTDLLLVNMAPLEKIGNSNLNHNHNHNLHFKLSLVRPLLPLMYNSQKVFLTFTYIVYKIFLCIFKKIFPALKPKLFMSVLLFIIWPITLKKIFNCKDTDYCCLLL